MQEERGLWIPPHVWNDPDLNFQEKGFLAEIERSATRENGCMYTNKDFSLIFARSRPRCSEIVKSLEDKGKIRVMTDYNEGGLFERRLFSLLVPHETPVVAKRAGATRSQPERVLDWLHTNGPLTQEQAAEALGVSRLSGRIHELRQRGYRIEARSVPGTGRTGGFGEKTEYYLAALQTVSPVREGGLEH